MRKFLAIVIMLISMPIFAQDAFFTYESADEGNQRSGSAYPIQNSSGFGVGNMQNNQTLPLGNGLLLLVGSGIGYAILKKKEETK